MSLSNQAPEVRFDRKKFLAAVHYIVLRCTDRPDYLGKTKLHKSLYYSDMLYYISTKRPLTGVEYVKAQFGPTARYLDWALKTLSERGLISVSTEDYFGLGKFVFKSERDPSEGDLLPDEKALLDEVIEFVCQRTAREISELSHARPWKNASMGESIPYYTAHLLLPSPAPSPHLTEWAEEQVRRTGTR